MGCGGSKEEVATANTVTKRSLFRRKSSVSTGKSSSATMSGSTAAENQNDIKTENPGKTEEKIESAEKDEMKTKALQNSGDKAETSIDLTKEKTKTVEKLEEKNEAMENVKTKTVEKSKTEDETTVVETNKETMSESKNIASLKEEGKDNVVKLDEPVVLDTSTVVDEEQDLEVHDNSEKEEIKDSTVIAEVSEKKEDIISKEAHGKIYIFLNDYDFFFLFYRSVPQIPGIITYILKIGLFFIRGSIKKLCNCSFLSFLFLIYLRK
jgi:hypothetical protein